MYIKFLYHPPNNLCNAAERIIIISFEKLINVKEKQLYFLTVCISKWFQLLYSSFSNLNIALTIETDLRGEEEMYCFNLTSKDTKTV